MLGEKRLATIDAKPILRHQRIEMLAMRLDTALHTRKSASAQHCNSFRSIHQSQTISFPRQMRHLFLTIHQIGTQGRRTMS